MAREIVVKSNNGRVSRFQFQKIERSKLYGKRRRIPLDPNNEPCTRAQLAADGSILLRAGMLAQGYFQDDGKWIKQSQLQGMDGAGRAVEKEASTLGVEQELEAATPEDLLDLDVTAIYALEKEDVDTDLAKSLAAGDIYHFRFNYRADYHSEIGYLIANESGIYCIAGNPIVAGWSELGQMIETEFDEDSMDDDLDFEMF